jgi:hypothetical protein
MMASAPQAFENNLHEAQNQSIRGREWQPAYPAPAQHDDLLSKHKDLCFQRCPWSKQIEDETEDQFDEICHPAPASPDSARHANQIQFTTATRI